MLGLDCLLDTPKHHSNPKIEVRTFLSCEEGKTQSVVLSNWTDLLDLTDKPTRKLEKEDGWSVGVRI